MKIQSLNDLPVYNFMFSLRDSPVKSDQKLDQTDKSQNVRTCVRALAEEM